MRGWLAACVLGLLLAPAGAAAQWDDVREVEDAVWHDCLRSLPEGPLSRRTRDGVVPIGIPEHQAELRTLRPRARAHWQGLLAFDSEAMAICRPALTAQVFSDQPRFTGGLIGLGIWSVYTIGAGIGSSLWPFTPAAASPASLPFLGAHFSGAPAWRVVGIRRAMRRHADGESLRDALLAEVPKADGLGWFMGGASMAGGAYLMVLPSLIRGAIETQRGIPIAPGATMSPHELPAFPAALARLLAVVGREHHRREVSEVLGTDPALAGDVLRYAGSAAGGTDEGARSMEP